MTIFAGQFNQRRIIFGFGLTLAPFIVSALATAQTSGLVAAYGFNEGSGSTVTDLSGNNLNGTIVGATWTTQGKYANALSFNGSSNYVNLGNPAALRLTGSMTIEAWVKASANPADDGQIVAKSNNSSGWQLKTSPDTGPHTFGMAVSGSSSSHTQRYSATTRALDTWYHVAGVYNAASRTLDIYVNGTLNNSTLTGTIPSSQFNANVNVNIGRRIGGFYFNGVIDEVRIYNRALTQAEIQNDMNAPLGAAGPDTHAPSAPANLTANALSGGQINLTWTASTDNVAVTGYIVERCLGIGCVNFMEIGAPSGTTYNDTGVTAGNTYNYRVRATDAANNLSGYSNAAAATTPAPDTQPPTAPANLTANAVSGGQINLTWTAPTDNVAVTAYLVERCQGAGCANFAQIADPAEVSFSDIGLTPNTSYSYRVRAIDAASNLSSYSGSASATTLAVPSGLVAAYSFNEGGGAAVGDSSGYGNNGNIANATWTASGKYGNALVFNGSSALVTVPDAALLRLTTVMTLEAWVRPSLVNSAWRDVIYKGDDNYYLEGTSTASSAPAAGGTFGGASINLFGVTALGVNTWTYLAATYDGATLRLYMNGTQVSSVARTGSIATSTNPLQIGGDSIYGQYFAGVIDEVRIYNVALTQAQIQSDMNTPIGPAGPDTQPPTAPTSLAASAFSPNQINLSWTASTDNVGVTGYLVESCLTASCTFTKIATSPALTYNNTGLAPGIGYSYRVRATDAAGNLSPYSNVASASTPAADTQPPTAPTNLATTPASSGQINLSWTPSTDNVGIHGYSVERCLTSSCTFTVIVPYITSTIFSDTGLTPGTGYSYRVQASDSAGNLSQYSNVASAATSALDTQPPTASANLTATTASSSQINLSWTASTDNVGVTSYLVESCLAAACTFAQIAATGVTTYNNTGLAPGVDYSYRVRATDAAGNLSPYSNAVTATTLTTIPGLVVALSFNEGAGATVGDSSGNGNNGTVTNATWTTSGKYGNALVFNGSNALISVADSALLHLTTAMTLEAWVKPSTVNSAWRDVIYKGNDNYYLEGASPSNGAPAVGGTFGSANTNIYGTTGVAVNAWTHLAATYDGATFRLYVNGTQVSSEARTGSIATSTYPLQIGGDSIYGQYFAGVIDEVRIYNVALTQAQIQSDMNTPIGTATPSPIVSLSSTAVTFGNQATGTASPAQNITMTNVGLAPLTITGISIIGPNSADFTQTNNCGSSLAAAGTCTISVTFVPTTTGTRAAGVAIADNAPFSPQTISLTGMGTGFSVSPRVTVLNSTMTQQFNAGSAGSITWSVDGIAGGSATVGTITGDGLYAPPASAGVHTVTATTSTSQSASATVYISNYPGTFTFHNDNFRTGQNLAETVLTPVNVNSLQFGKLFSYATDGISHASPLYVANVNIPGSGFHNVVYVATEHNTVYAFDADGRSPTPLWQVSFINPSAGITPVPSAETGEAADIAPEIGITGTPVIDQNSGTLYVVAKTKEVSGGTTSYVHRLHALDIATGSERPGSPVAIQASVPGTGTGSSGGQLAFNSLRHNQRPALLLSNGVVYIAFGSHGDQAPYHGWVLGYNNTPLQRVMAYCVTPNGAGGGIWQSGMGLAADTAGNIYFMTANGTFNANTGGLDYGDTFIKLRPSGVVLDYFTPHTQDVMNVNNWDLASSGTLLLPEQTGGVQHLLLGGGKNASLYLVNRNNLGHYNANNDNQIVQSLVNIFPNGTPEPGNYSSPVYFNGTVYFSPVSDRIKAFGLNNGILTTSPISTSPVVYPYPGGWIALSANGATNGILWAIQRNDPGVPEPGTAAPGVLRAYLATDLNTELYNSTQAGSRDALDYASKFTVPLVANGKVFVLTNGRLTAFGLLP